MARSSPSCCKPSSRSSPAAAAGASDIMVSGLLARCTAAALTSHELPPPEQIRYGVATLSCSLAGFLALGVAMLAQLATGWQWFSPHSAPVATGTVIMVIAVGCLALGRHGCGSSRGVVRHCCADTPARRTAGLAGWPDSVVLCGRACCRRAALRERLARNRRHRAQSTVSFRADWPRSDGRRLCRSPRSGRIRRCSAGCR